MPDVYENPFTAALLDFFEEQQNARKKAPWASETPATWSDGTPILDAPDTVTGPTLANPLEMPKAQKYGIDITSFPDDTTVKELFGHTYDTVGAVPDVGSDFSRIVEFGSVPTDEYDDIMSLVRDRRFGTDPAAAPFYDAMLEDERVARLLDDYGIGPEEFVPELPVSKFTTDFRTDPSFLKLDAVDDALLMGDTYGVDDYLAGLSSFKPGKMPVNAMDDVFDLAKNSAKAGKRAGSGLAASFRKLKNII